MAKYEVRKSFVHKDLMFLFFLSAVPAPVASPNPVDQNNGWALFYNTTAGPLTFVWTSQGGPVNDWASIAVAFKAAP